MRKRCWSSTPIVHHKLWQWEEQLALYRLIVILAVQGKAK